MYTGVWKYPDPKHQTAYFRGYVYWYSKTGAQKVQAPCPTVQKSRALAEKDAKKLLNLLKLNETMDKELIKDIKGWLADYRATQPDNLDIDTDSFEGSAYSLLARVLADSADIEKVINNLKKNVVYGGK